MQALTKNGNLGSDLDISIWCADQFHNHISLAQESQQNFKIKEDDEKTGVPKDRKSIFRKRKKRREYEYE